MKKGAKKAVWGAALLLALVGGGAGGYVYWTNKPVETPAGSTLTVARGTLVETASASGKIQPHVQVEVKSRTSGEVVEILVAEGDQVTQGQLLVRLDPTDAERGLAEAKVSLQKVRADLAAAQASLHVADLDRKNSTASDDLAKKSAEMGLGSQDALRTSGYAREVATANVSLRNAQLAATRTQLQTAELAVQDAELRLKETKIYAPMAGTILDIAVEKGTIVASALTNVSGGTAVMTLADLSDLRIIAPIDEAQVGRVKVGQKVAIRVDAYAERVFSGTVERVSPLGVETSNVVTFDVEVIVKDEQSGLLKSGMSADVEITTTELEDVVLVPLTAVQSAGRARFVQLASGEKRKIKTGASDGANLVVVEGLEGGEEIAATAPVTARPGGPGAPGGTGTARAGGGASNPMRGMGMGR